MDQKKKKTPNKKSRFKKKKNKQTIVSGQWKATKQQQHVIGYPTSGLNLW